ncbi:hypothetical protein CFBP5875_01500 [Agrobacterium pusense]|uniref:hypothetical protein n=1 Tax=Agrobacterium pusense TaxID=648995 RepID=UPI0010BE3834|nr:hypothetical protein [Agrobacterium pusense]QCL83368.1 hypothetical protein CFBP5875_01500 [Agrobacterium pusense]
MTCKLQAQKITPYGFLYLATGTLDDMGPVADAVVARRHGSKREDILLISIATGWTNANTGQPLVQQYNIDLTSEKDLKRLYSLLKKRGCLNSFWLVRRILEWSDQVFSEHEAKIGYSPDPLAAKKALIAVRAEADRTVALARISDLMSAKAGTREGEELSRLTDWVLEYDVQEERRKEIEALRAESQKLYEQVNAMSDLVGKLAIDLTALHGRTSRMSKGDAR